MTWVMRTHSAGKLGADGVKVFGYICSKMVKVGSCLQPYATRLKPGVMHELGVSCSQLLTHRAPLGGDGGQLLDEVGAQRLQLLHKLRAQLELGTQLSHLLRRGP